MGGGTCTHRRAHTCVCVWCHTNCTCVCGRTHTGPCVRVHACMHTHVCVRTHTCHPVCVRTPARGRGRSPPLSLYLSRTHAHTRRAHTPARKCAHTHTYGASNTTHRTTSLCRHRMRQRRGAARHCAVLRYVELHPVRWCYAAARHDTRAQCTQHSAAPRPVLRCEAKLRGGLASLRHATRRYVARRCARVG